MALKMLKLKTERKQAQTLLDTLREKKADFEKRSAELEKAVGEAVTDEDIKTVEENITALEQEIADADIDNSISAAENELERIDGEIKELEKRTQTAQKPVKDKTERKAERVMNKRFWKGISAETRSAVMENDEVKGFMERLRAFGGQTRAVTGAELAIPVVMLELIRDNLNRYSKLIEYINVKPVAGKARQTIAGTVPEGVWTEAIGAVNELEIKFNQVEVDGYKVGGFIPVHNSILEDSDINLSAEILDMLGQAIGYAVDKAILYGTGVKMPLGIVTRLAQPSKPSDWGENAPTWTNLSTTNILKIDGTLTDTKFFAALVGALGTPKANYSDGRKFWAMSSKTKADIIAKSITFNAAGAVVAGANDEMPVIGGKIITFDFIPDGDIIGGYGALYLLAERAGAALTMSEHVRFIEDMTLFKGTARYDGMPVIGAAFVAVNINNKAVTTSVTFAADSANTPHDESGS